MINSLVKNTTFYFVTSFFAQGAIFLLWIILAWYLDPSQIGIYSLAMFVVELFGIINLFGLTIGLPKFYHSKEHDAPKVFVNSFSLFIISSFASLVLFFLSISLISSFIPDISEVLKGNLFLFAGLILFNSANDFILSNYTALKKAMVFSKFHLARISLFFILSLVFVSFSRSIISVFSAFFISSLTIVVYFLIRERKMLKINNIDKAFISQIAFYGFPLMLYGFLVITASYFSRIILSRYVDLSLLGIYTFFLMIVLQINGLWNTFNRAWIPEIFSKISENKKAAVDYVVFMVFFSSFIYLAGLFLVILLGELFIFKLILKEVYFLNRSFFYILLTAPVFGGIYISIHPLCYFRKNTFKILTVFSFVSVLNILFVLLLINAFSITGAVLSYFAASVFNALAYSYFFRKDAGIPKSILIWTVFLGLFLLAGIILYILTESLLLFLLTILLSCAISFRVGGILEKRQVLISIFKELKLKIKNGKRT